MKKASAVLSLSDSEMMSELRENYDGYCFESGAETRVFNPWSVLNFLNAPQEGFVNYWILSGGLTSMLVSFFKSRSLLNPEDFQKPKTVTREILSASTDLQGISDVALLTQAGYLTIKSYKNGQFYVGYPNKEVGSSMGALYSGMLLKGQTLEGIGAGSIAEVLDTATLDEIFENFNKIFSSLDYMRYPVRDESVCRGFIQAMLQGARIYSRIEVHNAYGRSDLEVETDRRHWVFEFKFLREDEARSDESVTRLLNEAVAQMVARHYGKQIVSARQLMRAAAVFSGKTRRFEAWRLVTDG